MCADVKAVFDIMKKQPKYLDTADVVRDGVIAVYNSSPDVADFYWLNRRTLLTDDTYIGQHARKSNGAV